MNNKETETTSNIGNKVRSSLVLKLHLKMLSRIFFGFMTVDIILGLLLMGFSFWKVEQGAQFFLEEIKKSPNGIETKLEGSFGYELTSFEEGKKGIIIPGFLKNFLPIRDPEAVRRITIVDTAKEKSLLEKVKSSQYKLKVSSDDQVYNISYPIGHDFRLYINLLFILMLFQGFILIGNMGKGTKMIRRTLQPLADLAETARNLNAEIAALRYQGKSEPLRDLAGVISNIDANKLDRRLSIDGSHDELKALSIAINGMLNRISESYESQVRFVSDASHELRTPIAVIQGYANLLDRWGKNDQKTMQEAIEAIKSEAENMKELVEQLLFLARGDNETMRFQLEILDASEVLEEIVGQSKIIDPNHIFETKLTRPAYLNADKQLLKQALRILIDNSIKYTPSGEKIAVFVTLQEDTVSITIQDNGIGIIPEDLEHIFDRFYRSDESRARKTGGSGLGLAIAKWIVEKHEGYLEVLSRKDIGTRTTIVLPAAKEEKNMEFSNEH